MMLVLALATVAWLSACSSKDGDKGGPSATPSGSQAAQTSSASSAASGDSAAQEQDDLPKETGDKTITFLVSDTGATYPRTMQKDNVYVKYLNEISGYDTSYEFLIGNGDEFTAGITARFASGDLPHVIRTNSVDHPVYHPGAVDAGVFWDLTDLLDKYAPMLKKSIPQEMWDSPKVTHNGRIYGIPQPLGFYASSRVMYVRQDWLDQLNMKQPYTLDEWLAFYDAVSRTDLNGNGKQDEFGLVAKNNLEYSEIFFQNYEAYPSSWYEHDGQLIPGIIAPGMKNALLFWKQLYDKKYINQDFLTTSGEQGGEYIYGSRAASWVHDVGNYSYSWGPDSGQWPEGVKPAISMLTGADGATLTPMRDGIYFVKVFPKQHENIVDVLKYLEWAWTSPEATKFFHIGIPGYNYTEENGKVNWSSSTGVNAEDNQYFTYQVHINPVRLDINNDSVLSTQPDANILFDGLDKAKKSEFKNVASLYMPTLQSLQNNPELLPGTAAGTLFMDLFAKVVTGREDVEQAFPAFVEEWKRRGGDKAIEEATAWYRAFNG